MINSKNFNFIYISTMVLYFFANACFGAFGNLFMTKRGLGESEIGLVFSIASLLALLIQFFISKVYDNYININSRSLLGWICALSILGVLFLAMVNTEPLTAIFFAISWALVLSIVPLLSSIFIEYKNIGYRLSFNIPRAFGSLSYSIASILLGRLFSHHLSSEFLLIFILVSLVGVFFLSKLFPVIKKGTSKMLINEVEVFDLVESEYDFEVKNFKWLLVGIIFLLIMHNLITSYMLQFVGPLGGGARHVGVALAISALVEVPTLISYGFLSHKLSHRLLLFISSLGFLTKSIVILFAQSLWGIYLGQFLQIFGFALYVVAIIEYTDQIMDPAEAIRAQFQINIALTLGGIIGNMVGGYLLEYVGVRETAYFGVITSLMGTIFFYMGLRRPRPGLEK